MPATNTASSSTKMESFKVSLAWIAQQQTYLLVAHCSANGDEYINSEYIALKKQPGDQELISEINEQLAALELQVKEETTKEKVE